MRKIKQWYDDHAVQFRVDKADVFMIATDDQASADQAYAALNSGQAFADVAKDFSVDPRTKDAGGALGNMDMGNFPPQMTAAIDALAPGAFSTPIDMGQGFMILKVENRQKVTPFEEVKDQIKEDALKETAQEVVKELREKAAVEFPAEVTATDTKVAAPAAVEAPKADAPTPLRLNQNNHPARSVWTLENLCFQSLLDCCWPVLVAPIQQLRRLTVQYLLSMQPLQLPFLVLWRRGMVVNSVTKKVPNLAKVS